MEFTQLLLQTLDQEIDVMVTNDGLASEQTEVRIEDQLVTGTASGRQTVCDPGNDVLTAGCHNKYIVK